MDRKLAGLISLFFLTFFVFLSVMVFQKPLSRFTRAAEDSEPSAEKSLMFAWPLTIHPTPNDSVKIDVFVRSKTGKPLATRELVMNATLGTISPKTAITDKFGKASFTLTSEEVGTSTVTAIVDNSIEVAQKVTIKVE